MFLKKLTTEQHNNEGDFTSQKMQMKNWVFHFKPHTGNS